MIEQYKKEQFLDLYIFLKNNRNSDFYYTQDNKRYFINTKENLRNFLKSVNNVYLIQDRGDIQGVIALWSSEFNNGKRYFVKVNAIDNIITDKLLTIILWNFSKELYLKIHKFSKYLPVFYNKGFKFIGVRGFDNKELLLYRTKTYTKNINIKDEENSDERNYNKE